MLLEKLRPGGSVLCLGWWFGLCDVLFEIFVAKTEILRPRHWFCVCGWVAIETNFCVVVSRAGAHNIACRFLIIWHRRKALRGGLPLCEKFPAFCVMF